MRLARVIGPVTATVKDARLSGAALLLTDLIDGRGTVLSPGHIAVDTVGAGPGDTVIVTAGSAARMAAGLATSPVDLSIIAIVDGVGLTG